MLGLIEKVCRSPEQVGPADIQAVRDAGASDQAIRDALYVATLFGVLSRLADSLGWRIPAEEAFQRTGKFLLARGYAFVTPLAWIARASKVFSRRVGSRRANAHGSSH